MNKVLGGLHECQVAAICHVAEHANASALQNDAVPSSDPVDDMYLHDEHNRIAALIVGDMPVDVNFHPDRTVNGDITVIEGLIDSLIYENQFVSGVSNGLFDVSLGSSRKRWESQLFGCVYDSYPDIFRPKYGAINIFDSVDGACPRFGSCYFRLRAHVHDRCTLSYGDSHFGPVHIGTSNEKKLILYALYEDYFGDGETDLKGTSLKSVSRRLKDLQKNKHEKVPARNLDDIIEVQIHGTLRINRDVEFMSVDSSYSGTEIGKKISNLARKSGIDIRWHPGLKLQTTAVPPEFRGEDLIEFMKHCWPDGEVDAHRLGQLANAVKREPQNFISFWQSKDSLQLIKQTWHSIAVYGEPIESNL